MKFNIARLVAHLGGAAKTAEICGVGRTAPYGWIKRGYISQVVLERVKNHDPALDLDDFFEETVNEDDARCSAGVP
jgi:hypothetical protein